ncbi:peptidase M23-like protein [Isoptericola sp. CG 20/1183]|uniref:Peptidase M23-like protein n=1 Tax=Isoptericola halotolerans TaxID=300560 RepID=A0ABX5EEY6_9MICO|nr:MULTISPECIES: M23 family metallopeptidase [Isoptericola]PRZ07672.1 peptidase M23-like protein [Isoptericola halotolerans]PRZ07969.1 peptidase M23-like protein [Isoptericola sp. CG 20/1183]
MTHRPASRLRRIVGAAVVGLLVLGPSAPALADEIDDQRAAAEREKAEKDAERKELEVALEDTNAEFAQAVLDLNAVEARLPVAQAELAEAQAALAEARRKAEVLAQRLADAEDEETRISEEIAAGEGKAEEARTEVAAMAREAYRRGDDVSTLGLVTGAQSTQEFLEDVAVNSSAARSQSRAVAELQEAETVARNQEARLAAIRETIADLKAEADANVVVAEQAEQDAAERKAEVEQLIEEQKQLKATIEDRREETVAELEENEAQRATLEDEIQQIIVKQEERDRRLEEERKRREAEERRQREAEERRQREAERQAAENNNNGGGGGGGSSSGGGSGSGGDGGGGGSSSGGGGGSSSSGPFLGWPTNYHVVTSSYGQRFHPLYNAWRLHAGTDIRSYCGTPIYSAQSGYVEQAYYGSGPGNNVLINHGRHKGDSVMSRYLHLSRDVVRVGEKVDKGEIIGYSGTTGSSTACHLHFEVYVNGSTVDPMGGWLN